MIPPFSDVEEANCARVGKIISRILQFRKQLWQQNLKRKDGRTAGCRSSSSRSTSNWTTVAQMTAVTMTRSEQHPCLFRAHGLDPAFFRARHDHGRVISHALLFLQRPLSCFPSAFRRQNLRCSTLVPSFRPSRVLSDASAPSQWRRIPG